jgi:photosystem II stability/assembly factor-like uncharacterized protein
MSALPALANGRFPRAERLLENPVSPGEISIAGTYGILTTRDRGANWYHVCEASFSLQDAYLGDPLLDLMADQSLLVGVQTSLNLSKDGGCQWTPVLAADSTYVMDDAIARSEPATVLALLWNYQGGTVTYSLAQSLDGGVTWGPVGAPLPADIVYTLDVDPHDAEHLYATGLVQGAGQLFLSHDRGATWSTRPIPNTDASRAPYIAAIDPLAPEKIFVRTDAWVEMNGALTADDALLYSADGGATWTHLFQSRAKLLGFALSPDGSTVLLGYGDPQEGAGQVVPGPFGVFESATDRFAFEQVYEGRVGCLAWTASGIYVCGSQSFDGFELALASPADLAADASRWTPLLELDQVRGPLACDAGTTGAVCSSAWEVACATFGACPDAGTPRGEDAAARAEAGELAGATAGGGCRAARRPSGEDTLPALVAMVCLGLCRSNRRWFGGPFRPRCVKHPARGAGARRGTSSPRPAGWSR